MSISRQQSVNSVNFGNYNYTAPYASYRINTSPLPLAAHSPANVMSALNNAYPPPTITQTKATLNVSTDALHRHYILPLQSNYLTVLDLISLTQIPMESFNYIILSESEITTSPIDRDTINEENVSSAILGYDSQFNWLELSCTKKSDTVHTCIDELYDNSLALKSDKRSFLAKLTSRSIPLVGMAIDKSVKVTMVNEDSERITFIPSKVSGIFPIMHATSLLFSDYLEFPNTFHTLMPNEMSDILKTEVMVIDKTCFIHTSNDCIREYSYLTMKSNITNKSIHKQFVLSDGTANGLIGFLDSLSMNSIDKISFFVSVLVEQLSLDQSIVDPEVAANNYVFMLLAKNFS